MAIEMTEALQAFGRTLQTKLDKYKRDRQQKIDQMMTDLRQYRAEYDPELKSKLDAAGRSKVYPRDTRLKTIGFVAKMMEMMFPASERNWSVTESEYPNIPLQDLQFIIAGVEQQRLQEAQAQQTDPQPVTSEDIETAVKAWTKKRAVNMEREIEDQLSEMPEDYPHLAKRVLHSGALFGWGVLAGPLTITKKERMFVKDAVTGQWSVKEDELARPTMEYRRAWDIYPDMSAKTWRQQEGLFDRHVMSRHDLTLLADRDDFEGEIIKQYLRDHDTGNYKAESYEAELRVLDQTMNTSEVESRRYEVFRYFGFVSAKNLEAIGVEIAESDLYLDVLVDIWFISGIGEATIIKAEKAVFGEDVGDQYHPYFYDDEDEAGLLGISLPQVIRDSQMKLCAVDRMIMDNSAACLGPITTIDKSRLAKESRGKDLQITSFTTIYTDTSDQPQNSSDVVKSFQPEAHINELLKLKRDFKSTLDMESNVQPITLGDPTGIGEAFRTSGNMSQLTGGANMITKDQVRAFDRFTSSVIGALVRWNMAFTTKDDIKGDFQPVARGNISLVAKEVRGAALAQWKETLTPRQQVLIKERDLTIEELRSRDLPTDVVLPEKEAAAALERYDAAQSQAASIEQGLTQAKTEKESAAAQKNAAQAQEIAATVQTKVAALAQQGALAVAKAQESLSKAKGVRTKNELDTVKLIFDQINGVAGAGGGAAKKAAGAGKRSKAA